MKDDVLGRKISSRARVLAAPAALATATVGRGLRRARAQSQTTVRLTGWTSSGAEKDQLTALLQDFETANPTIKINYEPITGDYWTKIQTDMAAGSVADVMYMDTMPAPDAMASGQLLQIDDYMASSGVKAEDFYPGLIAAHQWQGKTYGIPKDWSSLATVYGTQAFSDAGIASAPATWDDLKAAGQALKDKTGEARIMISPDLARELPFHYAAGGEVISKDGNSIVLDSPEGQQALDFYYGLYRDQIATTFTDAGAQWPGDGFSKDLADLVFEGNWMFPFLQDAAPDLKFSVAELPAGPKGKANLAFSPAYAIFVDTKVADAAWTVVNWLTGPEGMAKWTSGGLAMPTRPALAADWIAKFPERKPYIDSGDYARGWQLGVGGLAFYNDSTAELQALFAGQQDVPTTLKRMADAAKRRITLGGGPPPEATPGVEASPTA
jgi:multiple sugar transport system substrate-binding protein